MQIGYPSPKSIDIWDTLLTQLVADGSIGELLVTKLENALLSTSDPIEIVNSAGAINTISSGGGAWVYGAWVQLFGALGQLYLITAIEVIIGDRNVARTFEVNIGFGTPASEVTAIDLGGRYDALTADGRHKTSFRKALPVPRFVTATDITNARVRDNSNDALDYEIQLELIRL